MDGTRHLLLLPGLDGTDVFFRPLISCLPPGIHARVVPYPDDGPNDYPALLELVRAAAAATGPCWVMASSFGGPLAVLLAAAEPELVRGLILSATFLRTPDRRLARWRFLVVPPVVGLVRTARRLPVWMKPAGDPMRVAKAEVWARVSARTLAPRARAILSTDVRSIYRGCRQPVLCTAFADDRVVPRDCASEIVDGRPQARLAVLPGGHLGMHTHPRPLAGEVAAFVGARGGLDTAAAAV